MNISQWRGAPTNGIHLQGIAQIKMKLGKVDYLALEKIGYSAFNVFLCRINLPMHRLIVHVCLACKSIAEASWLKMMRCMFLFLADDVFLIHQKIKLILGRKRIE